MIKHMHDKTYPMRKTLQFCEANDWIYEQAEQWRTRSHTKRDMFGFIDVLALTGDFPLAIQATTRTNMPARVRKITRLCNHEASAWIRCGGRIEVWGWDKRDDKWRLKITNVTADDIRNAMEALRRTRS